MAKPNLEEYLDAAFQANGEGSLGTGLTPLVDAAGNPVQTTINSDGFSGTAFVTKENQVIVAFKGTDIEALKTDPEFVIPAILADYDIYRGLNPAAFSDGVTFANQAIAAAAAKGVDVGNVFIDGHSLGGGIAAYVSAQLGLDGTTLAAPGLAPGDIPANPTVVPVAYVEYGDPIGNYGSNPNFEGNFLYDPGITRFGDTTYIGDGSFTDDAADRLALQLAGALYGKSDRATAASLLLFAEAAAKHHPLTGYSKDLGYQPPSGADDGSGIDPAQLVASVEAVIAQLPLAAKPPLEGAEPGVTVSFDANARFVGPATAVLTGTVSDPTAVSGIEVYATSAQTGGLVDLGSATVNADGTWSLRDTVGSDTQSGFIALATDTGGLQTADIARFSLTAGITGESYGAVQNNYAPDGTFTGQNLFGPRGGLYVATQVATNPDGSSTLRQQGGRYFVGSPVSATLDHYDASGALVEEDLSYKDGSTTIQGFTGGLTLQSIRNDAFHPTGSRNTFVFTPGFGRDLVTGFDAFGADHDTISLSSSAFTGVVDVLLHTRDTRAGAVITDRSSGDTITLAGVTKTDLIHNKQDFSFQA